MPRNKLCSADLEYDTARDTCPVALGDPLEPALHLQEDLRVAHRGSGHRGSGRDRDRSRGSSRGTRRVSGSDNCGWYCRCGTSQHTFPVEGSRSGMGMRTKPRSLLAL